MRRFQEQVKKVFCCQKLFWPFTVWINWSSDLKIFANSRPSASNFKSFLRSSEHFFLTVGQHNFGNKIPIQILYDLTTRHLVFSSFFLTSNQVLAINLACKCSCKLPTTSVAQCNGYHFVGYHFSKLYYKTLCNLPIGYIYASKKSLDYSYNKITTTQIQIIRQNWNGCFSNIINQMMI